MKQRGFTLIELLVVVSIIGLLSSVVLAALNGARIKGTQAKAQSFSMGIWHAQGDQAAAIFTFNECSGSVANDSSGNNYVGTLNNMVAGNWSTDVPLGNACSLIFDATNRYVSVPYGAGSALDFSATSKMTITFWLKTTSTAGSSRTIEALGTASGWGVEVNPTGGSSGSTILLNTFSGANVSSSAGIVPIDGAWHHFAVTYDGATATFYKDGAKFSSAAYTPGWTSAARTLYIGGDGSFPYTGSIDDVRIYKNAISADAVRQIYARGAGRFYAAR